MLIDLFNPERIVIGSIFTRAEKWFRQGMLENKRSAGHIAQNRCHRAGAIGRQHRRCGSADNSLERPEEDNTP